MIGDKKKNVCQYNQPIYPAMKYVTFFAPVLGENTYANNDIADHDNNTSQNEKKTGVRKQVF